MTFLKKVISLQQNFKNCFSYLCSRILKIVLVILVVSSFSFSGVNERRFRTPESFF